MARRGPEEIVQVNLRIPERLRRELAQEAKRARRSLNQEMILRLEQTFERVDADAAVEKAKALMEGFDRLTKELKGHIFYRPSPPIQVPDVSRPMITIKTKEKKK